MIKANLLALAICVCATSTWAGDWHNSKWGPDDEIGAANHITPASVLEASKLIKTGKTYSLGIVVGPDTPAFSPRSLSVTVLQPNQIAFLKMAEHFHIWCAMVSPKLW